MVIAEVSLIDLFWTALWVFFLIMFIWLFIAIVSDLFRDHELSGWTKAIWVVALIAFPLFGSLVYLIVRGQGMAHREMARNRAQQAQLDSYIRDVATASGSASGGVDDLARLAALRDNGTISDAEFETMKARVTGTTTATP